MINIVDWSFVRKFVRLASSRGNNASLVLVLAASGPLFPSTPFPQDQPLGVPLRGPPTTLHESRHRGEAAAKKKRGRVSHQGPTTTTGPSSTSPLPGRPPREHDYAEIKLGSLLCRAGIRYGVFVSRVPGYPWNSFGLQTVAISSHELARFRQYRTIQK